MNNTAEKIIHPDASKPDKFQSTRPWKTRVVQFSIYGAIIGTMIFGVIGFFMSMNSVEVPMTEHTTLNGWPFVTALAFAGLIATAVIGGLIALYTRDLKSNTGKGA